MEEMDQVVSKDNIFEVINGRFYRENYHKVFVRTIINSLEHRRERL
jgi:hypothetical protein